MIKRILIFGILLTVIQTFLYFLLIKLMQLGELQIVNKSEIQLKNSIIPWIVLLFFEVVLIQNILTSIVNRKTFTLTFFVLTLLFLWAGFLKGFSIWPSIPFLLLILGLLATKFAFEKYFERFYNKPIA